MTEFMFVVANKYKLEKKLGSGSFGDVYLGTDVELHNEVAIKLELLKCKHPQLKDEFELYQKLIGDKKEEHEGISGIYYYGQEGDFNVLVMDCLGPSLEDLFNYCGRRFSLKTVLMLLNQMLKRLQFVHSKGYIHRDIKPDNFIMGNGEQSHVCYLIDFGLSQRYLNQNKEHISYSEDKSLTGTARYASLNNHLGIEQSRRDDMESLAYSVIYLLRGSLPWQGLHVAKGENRYNKIYSKKVEIPVSQLCENLPSEFGSFLSYCRNLKFDEEPKYDFWRHIFQQVAQNNSIIFDYEYDWIIKRKAEKELV
ncbi:casein kinase 1, putative [Entamoeba nuttalli P19]|uniref:non-specific serine/threonine protein kinase n=2 Tax=Entamoeba nuttalli TaxID=412467 RepID=K2GJE4_ENTNP|nr:casein kinase 1, putative [Entamoeba nuttalli P19]EKE42906.1 casein kinase 1, putative [Entamoeba nuttalli P19]|eukprot:XP_008854758.1 casein kinase 1, putative [Entamoeba nuttalli P19]